MDKKRQHYSLVGSYIMLYVLLKIRLFSDGYTVCTLASVSYIRERGFRNDFGNLLNASLAYRQKKVQMDKYQTKIISMRFNLVS